MTTTDVVQEFLEADSSNPFYIHPNESPVLGLVDTVLDEKNYHDWSRSMRMGLQMKNKLGFIDGTITRPVENQRLMYKWDQCNSTVMSWIMRSLNKDIRVSVRWANTAHEMWTDLLRRYSNHDSFRLSDLLEEVSRIVQGTDSITAYFAKLKVIWNEIQVLRPIPPCECAVKCTCRLIPTVIGYMQSEHVIRFTKGLNDRYAIVKSQILLMKPLPSIEETFAMSIQLERQMEYTLHHPQGTQNMVFAMKAGTGYGRNGQQYRNSESETRVSAGSGKKSQCIFCGKPGHTVDACYKKHGKPKCTFCGYTGHTIEDCYQKNGHQDGWKPRKRVNHIEGSENVQSNIPAQGQEQHLSSSVSNITRQIERLGRLLDRLDMVESVGANVNQASVLTVNFKQTNQELQGKVLDTWILDSGATDHVACHLELFEELNEVGGIKITLPNRVIVAVSHVGTVPINNKIKLHGVLYVPSFHCNLLSLGRLTDANHLSAVFVDRVCIIQDKSGQQIGTTRKQGGLYLLKSDHGGGPAQFSIKNKVVCSSTYQ